MIPEVESQINTSAVICNATETGDGTEEPFNSNSGAGQTPSAVEYRCGRVDERDGGPRTWPVLVLMLVLVLMVIVVGGKGECGC
jgi:hypothetical protein